MVKTVKLADAFFVAPQLVPEDIPALAQQGFRSIINGRPDGEGEGQPAGRLIAAAACDAGLTYRHIPVETRNLGEAEVKAFAGALADLPAPVLAFCRSGTRVAILWSLSQVGHRNREDILQHMEQAGFAVDGLRQRLQARLDATTEVQ